MTPWFEFGYAGKVHFLGKRWNFFQSEWLPLEQKSWFLSLLGKTKKNPCIFWANNVRPAPRYLNGVTFLTSNWFLPFSTTLLEAYRRHFFVLANRSLVFANQRSNGSTTPLVILCLTKHWQMAPWLEHWSEFPEPLVLDSKLEWSFKNALNSGSELHLHFDNCQP